VLARARALGVAHAFTGDVVRALAGADVVMLALPVASIVAALVDPHIPWEQRMLVMDTGSTKRIILEAADRRLPAIRFVGGHPLAGSEKAGLAGASPSLFAGAAFPLVRGQYARDNDVRLARRLVKALGARPFDLDASTHDRITGLTIGLPHVLAVLLRDVYETERRRDPRVERLTGSSIRSAMRVSHSDPVMMSDLIASNRDQIEYWWSRMTGTAKPRKR
jgi:prephenate dehydrogenase